MSCSFTRQVLKRVCDIALKESSVFTAAARLPRGAFVQLRLQNQKFEAGAVKLF